MKTEKQLLLDELDSLVAKFDKSWDEKNYYESFCVYYKIQDINEKLGLYTPRLLKLIDYTKLDNDERTFLTNKF